MLATHHAHSPAGVLAAHQALYDRLRAFDFDDGHSRFTFAHRLARENVWSLAHAQRVIDEYRRFILLAMVAGHPVTPSDAVDQAWHLHLVYTRSYWDRLCGETLGRPLHHGPTRGGAQEHEKFADWYQRTLQRYRDVFGEKPPDDVWPPVSERFGGEEHIARVDRRRHFLIPRPRRTTMAKAAALVIFGSLALGAAGCARALGSNNVLAPLVIGVGAGAALLLLIKGIIWHAKRRDDAPHNSASSNTGCGAGAGWWFGCGCGGGAGIGGSSGGRGKHAHDAPDATDAGGGDAAGGDGGGSGCGGGASGCGGGGGGGCGGGGCGGG